MTSINDLPPELLVPIFSFYVKSEGHRRFLKNIPLVCKCWNDLHSSPSLWHNINFSSVSCLWRPWTWKELHKLGEIGLLSSARCLDLDIFTLLRSESEIEEMLRYCHNLRELRASHLSKVAMEILAVQCPNISKLDMRDDPFRKNVEDSLIPFLRVRGQNLTQLKLSCNGKNMVSVIAKYCHSLEELLIASKHFPNVQLPIDELVIGCPNLRVLWMFECNVVLSKVRHHKGFENIVEFVASRTNFGGLDLYPMMENSKALKRLDFITCKNVELRGLLNIPSDKVNHIEIFEQNLNNCPSTFLEQIVDKWRHTLTHICLREVERDLTKVLEAYLSENQNPKLEVLEFKRSGPVNRKVLNEVIRACENLQRVYVYGPECICLRDREKIEKYLDEMSNTCN